MKKNVTRLFREALAAGKASTGTLAEEAGYSAAMFELYANRRRPSRGAVLGLASALEARAQRLLNYAERLRGAAGDERVEGRSANAKASARRGRARKR